MKQGVEGSLGYCANGAMTIGKSDFKGGMITYAQKWKTAEIHKRKSGGGVAHRKEASGFFCPPTQGERWSGLNPPILSTNNKVTGATTNMLRKENRNKRHTCQEDQGPQAYYYTHEEKFKLPAELPPPGKYRNNMCPSGLEVHHPDQIGL